MNSNSSLLGHHLRGKVRVVPLALHRDLERTLGELEDFFALGIPQGSP